MTTRSGTLPAVQPPKVKFTTPRIKEIDAPMRLQIAKILTLRGVTSLMLIYRSIRIEALEILKLAIHPKQILSVAFEKQLKIVIKQDFF
jgi:hypothetical protein